MNKLVFLTLILVLTPLTVFGGNTKSYRVSFTIPQSVELSKEDSLTEEKEEETLVSERTVITEKTTRKGKSVILKTVVAK